MQAWKHIQQRSASGTCTALLSTEIKFSSKSSSDSTKTTLAFFVFLFSQPFRFWPTTVVIPACCPNVNKLNSAIYYSLTVTAVPDEDEDEDSDNNIPADTAPAVASDIIAADDEDDDDDDDDNNAAAPLKHEFDIVVPTYSQSLLLPLSSLVRSIQSSEGWKIALPSQCTELMKNFVGFLDRILLFALVTFLALATERDCFFGLMN